MDTHDLPPPVLLYQLATGHYVSQAIYVAAKLGIADQLAKGPRSHDELAAATGTHAPSLRRVLRLLASAGVLAEREDGTFELTELGACLRSGDGSFKAVAQLFAGPSVWASWGDLLDRQAIRILERCHRAMGPLGKLLIVEAIYPPRIDRSVDGQGAAKNDVNMMVCTGGRQRSEAEFRALFDTAGFKLTRIVPTMAMSSVIEGVRA